MPHTRLEGGAEPQDRVAAVLSQWVWPTVCCTAHRLKHLTIEEQDWSRQQLHRGAQLLAQYCGTRVGISGLAVGGDLWWADGVLRAGLTLAAHIPFGDQTRRWPEHSRREHARLLRLAHPELSHQYAGRFDFEAYDARNLGMLQASDAVIALWKPSVAGGGTYRALIEAAKLGRPGIHIDPQHRKITYALPDPRRYGTNALVGTLFQ